MPACAPETPPCRTFVAAARSFTNVGQNCTFVGHVGAGIPHAKWVAFLAKRNALCNVQCCQLRLDEFGLEATCITFA